MINIIIFSKDRACQLDLLYRSLKDRFKIDYNLSVLYRSTDNEYEDGYKLFNHIHPEVNCIKEVEFKKDLLNLTLSQSKYTLYLVDDGFFINDVIIDNVFERFDIDDSIMSLSLIKGRGTLYLTDKADVLCGQPEWIDQYLWNWKSEEGIWNYSMSVSMTVYRTNELYALLSKLVFNNANDLEDAMVRNPLEQSYMIGYDEIKLVNLDINIVHHHSRVTDIHLTNNQNVAVLNKKWLDGYRINSISLNKVRKDTYQHLTTKLDFERI